MDTLCTESAGAGMILCGNPKAQYISYKDEIDSAVKKVLERKIMSPHLILLGSGR